MTNLFFCISEQRRFTTRDILQSPVSPQKKRRKKEEMKKNPVKAVMKKPAAEKERKAISRRLRKETNQDSAHTLPPPSPNVVKQSPEKKKRRKILQGKRGGVKLPRRGFERRRNSGHAWMTGGSLTKEFAPGCAMWPGKKGAKNSKKSYSGFIALQCLATEIVRGGPYACNASSPQVKMFFLGPSSDGWGRIIRAK